VIAKYIQIDNDKVLIEVERGPDVSMLDINIELPAAMEAKRPKAPARRRLEGAAAAT
jgi:septum formation topological specificity factor MinE